MLFREVSEGAVGFCHALYVELLLDGVALVLSGGRVEAVSLEEALRRYFYAGLEQLADRPQGDPAPALRELASAGCAATTFTRYNGKNLSTLDRGSVMPAAEPTEPLTRFDDSHR